MDLLYRRIPHHAFLLMAFLHILQHFVCCVARRTAGLKMDRIRSRKVVGDIDIDTVRISKVLTRTCPELLPGQDVVGFRSQLDRRVRGVDPGKA